MKREVFADTDVCLDLLLVRDPFYEHAAKLFSLADSKALEIFISSLIFANVNYMLGLEFSASEVRNRLIHFKTLIHILPVDDRIIDLSLYSEFKDFEDGIQYYTAIESGLKVLLTRNLKDYKPAKISVMTPESYLKTLSK